MNKDTAKWSTVQVGQEIVLAPIGKVASRYEFRGFDAEGYLRVRPVTNWYTMTMPKRMDWYTTELRRLEV